MDYEVKSLHYLFQLTSWIKRLFPLIIIKLVFSNIINYIIQDINYRSIKSFRLIILYYIFLSFTKFLLKLIIILAICYLLYKCELFIKSSILFCLILKTRSIQKIYKNIVIKNFTEESSNKYYNEISFKAIKLW
jgi:hypothetical protein